KLLDWDYRRTAKEVGHEINKAAGDDLSKFPIEKARLRSIWYMIAIDITAIIGYGWSLHAKTVSIPVLSRPQHKNAPLNATHIAHRPPPHPPIPHSVKLYTSSED
ncbi:hypothetical protein MMC14_003434, partial [Varicellaria rhodocarpa]|nr:hypothetical protein [Varicellaria rhodocarpa]